LLNAAEDPLTAAMDMSDIIFVGEVVSRTKSLFQPKGHEERIMEVESQFAVKEVLKGTVPDKVVLIAKDSCDCRYDFEPGVEYVVMASIVGHHFVPKFCRFVGPSDSELTNEIRERLQ
jgi:hypothetical protein